MRKGGIFILQLRFLFSTEEYYTHITAALWRAPRITGAWARRGEVTASLLAVAPGGRRAGV